MDEATRTALESERSRLLTRLGEIDAALRAADADDLAAAEADASWVLLSSFGLLGRWESAEPLPKAGPRALHDVIVSAVRVHSDFGVLTNRGRIVKVAPADVPSVPVSENPPNLQGARRASEIARLEPGERALALTTLTSHTYGWALGTRQGVVKRTNPEMPRGADSWEVIRLEPGDEVVGAVELQHEQVHLVFITSDAQLLHYPASSVRPQGRAGGGIAGIKLDPNAEVLFFGAVSPQQALVVTNAGRISQRDTDFAGSLKVTPFAAFPDKGRATGGVRCHRFLKGEDVLYLAWAGPAPAIAATKTGSPSNLPAEDPKRDASGVKASLRLAAVGSRSLVG